MSNIMLLKKVLLGLFVFCSLLMTGCATGSKFTAAPAPQPGKALVYVYRKGNMVGSVNYPYVYVNSEYLAPLSNGSYAVREVPQGTVVFHALYKSPYFPGNLLGAALINSMQKLDEKLRIELEAGKTYYVRWYLNDTMKLEEQATGAKEIAELHLVTAGKN